MSTLKVLSVFICFKQLSLWILLTIIAPQINSNLTENNVIVFKANFSKPTLSKAFGDAQLYWGNKNAKFWPSGDGMDVLYPAGSYVPSKPIIGGIGFWTKHPVDTNTAIFKYSVYFPDDFNFVKGGKLPGLYGGHKVCTGGHSGHDCFSTRMMWRAEGLGELYLYANRNAQDPAICEASNAYCNPKYGWSLGTGSFTFARGSWTDIEQNITLNTPGERDGVVSIMVNGTEVIRYDNIVFRTSKYPNMRVEGMDIETYFGGNGIEWASPKDQTVKFKDFVLESY